MNALPLSPAQQQLIGASFAILHDDRTSPYVVRGRPAILASIVFLAIQRVNPDLLMRRPGHQVMDAVQAFMGHVDLHQDFSIPRPTGHERLMAMRVLRDWCEITGLA